VTTTTYASPQAVIHAHPVDLAGRCLACLSEGPCQVKRAALAALAIRGVLPRRWPGATRPELIGARRRVVFRG
jgi:hypothetical protein